MAKINAQCGVVDLLITNAQLPAKGFCVPLPENKRPLAIVLSRQGTGLAVIRCLAKAGIAVHAVIFEAGAAVNYSRYCRKITRYDLHDDTAQLIAFLIQYTQQLGNRPVVFPTSDAHALLLAEHFDQLSPYCRLWTTPYRQLLDLVNKGALYRLVASAGLPTIPALCEPTLAETRAWTETNPAPYFLKPFYEGVATSKLRAKNLMIPQREQLLNYIAQQGSTALIVQRLLQGGDGYIFDCYGYCAADGRIVTMASHRRWRQHLPDFGATCFGEIPASISSDSEALLFSNTTQLLATIRFHGIFGIEWLFDRQTEQYYLIDFNARPFTTIAHLQACGLNLPALAYAELTGTPQQNAIELYPRLRHRYWVDLLHDIETFTDKYRHGKIGLREWLLSLLRCRSFAYWDWLDPLPGLHRAAQIIGRSALYFYKKITARSIDHSTSTLSSTTPSDR